MLVTSHMQVLCMVYFPSSAPKLCGGSLTSYLTKGKPGAFEGGPSHSLATSYCSTGCVQCKGVGQVDKRGLKSSHLWLSSCVECAFSQRLATTLLHS